MGKMTDPVGGGKSSGHVMQRFVTDGHVAELIVSITGWQIVVG
jgi:hypothetical protein